MCFSQFLLKIAGYFDGCLNVLGFSSVSLCPVCIYLLEERVVTVLFLKRNSKSALLLSNRKISKPL